MAKVKHIDLFSGIGGASIAVDAVFGKNNVTHIFCDNEPFAQAILKKHWPEAKIYGDIRTLTYAGQPHGTRSGEEVEANKAERSARIVSSERSDSERPFILTGGFPCQPFSQAGRRKGTDDDRYLWPEMLRVIREFKPQWVIGENVAGLLTWDEGVVLEQVCLDLEGEGYEVQPFVIPAVAVNAPHRRDRVWIVAHSKREQDRKSEQIINNIESGRLSPQRYTSGENEKRTKLAEPSNDRSGKNWSESWLTVATRLCRVDDGLPNGLARPKGWRNAALKGAGNAWVPQVAIEIFKAIKQIDEQ